VSGPSGKLPSAIGSHTFEARAGHHLAPQLLSSRKDVFEELGDDFTLLAFDADAQTVCGFESEATRLRIPLKVVSDTRTDGRERYGASLILVRPDHFVAWASKDAPAEPRDVLSRAAGK
jgi:hypothetical protein